MLNPMNIYIQQLAEEARQDCVADGIIGGDICKLRESDVVNIIEYFNGSLKRIEDNSKNVKKELESNSILVKASDTDPQDFEIWYKVFSSMDILHELGHAFLELEEMAPGEARGCEDINGGINELNATKFARSFIMPRLLFEKVVVRNTQFGRCNIQAVADAFGVTYLQVLSQGRQLQIWK